MKSTDNTHVDPWNESLSIINSLPWPLPIADAAGPHGIPCPQHKAPVLPHLRVCLHFRCCLCPSLIGHHCLCPSFICCCGLCPWLMQQNSAGFLAPQQKVPFPPLLWVCLLLHCCLCPSPMQPRQFLIWLPNNNGYGILNGYRWWQLHHYSDLLTVVTYWFYPKIVCKNMFSKIVAHLNEKTCFLLRIQLRFWKISWFWKNLG